MLWRTRGVVPLGFNTGGANLLYQNTIPVESLQNLNAAFSPKLILHHMKEEDESGTTMETHLDRMQSYFPQCTHAVWGDTPSSISEGRDSSNAKTWRRLCRARNISFFDTYRVAIDYNRIASLGWQGDNVHLSDDFYRYAASIFCNSYAPLGVRPNATWIQEKARQRAMTLLAFRQPAVLTVIRNKSQSNGGHYDTNAGNTPHARYGFYTTGSGGGHSTGGIMVIPSTDNHVTTAAGFTLQMRVFGNQYGPGATGFIMLGAADAFITGPNKDIKGVGVEFGRPEDHGFSGGGTWFDMRIWIHDGSTLTTSPWVATPAYNGNSTWVLMLSYEAGRLSLSGAPDASQAFREWCTIRGVILSGTVNGNVYAGCVANSTGTSFMAVEDLNFFPGPKTFDPEPWG